MVFSNMPHCSQCGATIYDTGHPCEECGWGEYHYSDDDEDGEDEDD